MRSTITGMIMRIKASTNCSESRKGTKKKKTVERVVRFSVDRVLVKWCNRCCQIRFWYKTRNKQPSDKGDGVSLILRNGALAEFVGASHSSATRDQRLVSVVHRSSSSSVAFDALSIRRISLWLRGQRCSALCNRSTTLRRRLAAVCTTTCCSYHLLTAFVCVTSQKTNNKECRLKDDRLNLPINTTLHT